MIWGCENRGIGRVAVSKVELTRIGRSGLSSSSCLPVKPPVNGFEAERMTKNDLVPPLPPKLRSFELLSGSMMIFFSSALPAHAGRFARIGHESAQAFDGTSAIAAAIQASALLCSG